MLGMTKGTVEPPFGVMVRNDNLTGVGQTSIYQKPRKQTGRDPWHTMIALTRLRAPPELDCSGGLLRASDMNEVIKASEQRRRQVVAP